MYDFLLVINTNLPRRVLKAVETRNIAENLNRLSRAHERYRRQTDRQTTDGRATAYSEREREFTFAKNQVDTGFQTQNLKISLEATKVHATELL